MRRWRAYFNRKAEFPAVWAIDEGTQASEFNVSGFTIGPGCKTVTEYSGDKPNDDTPVAWLEIQASSMEVRGGWVFFE